MGNGVFFTGQAFDGGRVDFVSLFVSDTLGWPFRGTNCFKGHRHTLFIQASAKAHYGGRTKHVTQKFFLATPDHLDRSTCGLSQLDSLRVR
ncbi:hypothetical protein D3C75_641900 [compost metagenome]